MEIVVKTLNEARDSYVRVALRTGRGTEEVVEFVRQNAEVNLVPAETGAGQEDRPSVSVRRRHILDLQAQLAQRADLISELRGEVERAEEKIRLYDQDRHTERDRADENGEWAEREKDRAEKAEKLASEMKDRSDRLFRELHGSDGAWVTIGNAEAWANRAEVRAGNAEARAERAEKLAAEMKDRAEKAEDRVRSAGRAYYRENHNGVNDRQRIESARRSLRQYFPEQLITDDIAPRITDLGNEIDSLNKRLVEAETQRRLLSTATTALRKISMEVAPQGFNKVASAEDVIDNVRDLVSPWADTTSEDKD